MRTAWWSGPDARTRPAIGGRTRGPTSRRGTPGRVPMSSASSGRRRWCAGDAPGYWWEDKGAYVEEGTAAEVAYELVKQCSATLVGGDVRYLSNNQPAAGAAVALYLSGGPSPDLVLATDEQGHFVVNRSLI